MQILLFHFNGMKGRRFIEKLDLNNGTLVVSKPDVSFSHSMQRKDWKRTKRDWKNILSQA